MAEVGEAAGSRIEAAQSSTIGTSPESSFAVLQEAPDMVVPQRRRVALDLSVGDEIVTVESTETTGSRQPDEAILVLQGGVHRGGGQSVLQGDVAESEVSFLPGCHVGEEQKAEGDPGAPSVSARGAPNRGEKPLDGCPMSCLAGSHSRRLSVALALVRKVGSALSRERRAVDHFTVEQCSCRDACFGIK